VTTRRLALAALAGPPLFATILLVVTALVWDFLHDLGWSAAPFESPDAPWPSVLALSDYGFLVVLSFLVLGLSVFALASILGRRWKLGPAFLFLLGAGLCLAAFRTDYGTATGGGPETWNGTVHAVGFTLIVPATVLAMLVLGAEFRRDDDWQPSSSLSLVAGVLALMAVAGFLALGNSVFFWLYLGVALCWLELIARRALALVRVETAPA
jgi:hypothetical protein